MQIRNVTNQSIIVSRNFKFDKLRNYDEKNYYLISLDDRHLAVKSTSSWLRKVFKLVIVGLAELAMIGKTFHGFILPTSANTSVFFLSVPTIENLASAVMKTMLFNGITIYENASTLAKLSTVSKIYFNIWQKKTIGTVSVSKSDWMSIDTVSETKIESTRVFRLGKQNRNFIDKEFDEFHRHDKMSWITQFTPYAYSCFVVWRIVYFFGKPSKRKGKVVVDIRDFNKITLFDVYFMQLQFDFITTIIDCIHINIFDCIVFFH